MFRKGFVEPSVGDAGPFDDALASLEWVDPLCLEWVPLDERWSIDREGAAVLLDELLRRTSKQEALCRRVLGRLARPLIERRGYLELGFVRLRDYAEERLGLGARSVRDAARVAGGLDEHPVLERAFVAGELSWTRVRVLLSSGVLSSSGGLVEAGAEARWVAAARAMTVRALEKAVKSAAAENAPDDGALASETPATATAPASTEASEPRVTCSVPCPGRVAALFHATVRLASVVAGEELSVERAVEAITAEALSGASGEVDETVAERAAEELGRDRARRRERAAEWSRRWQGAGDKDGYGPEADGERIWKKCLEAFSAVGEKIPREIERLGHDVERVGPLALTPHELDRRLRLVVQAMQRIDWQVGRLLDLFFSLGLDRALGFRSRAHYVSERLGMSARKAEALVAIDRKGFFAPVLREHYRAGRISWVQASLIAPVVWEDEAAAAAWVERAERITVRRLRDELAFAREARLADRPFGSVWPPEEGVRIDPTDASHVLGAESAGDRATGEPQTRSTLDGVVALGGSVGPAGSVRWEPMDVEVRFAAPESVVEAFEDALVAWTEVAWGVVPYGERPWHALERLLLHVRGEWLAQPRHRDPVFARDGWRCAVPGCTSRRNLHDHHVRFRSRGGGNERENRVTVCAAHHLNAIHRGFVTAEGRAPRHVRWRLGVRAGKVPGASYVGDALSDGGFRPGGGRRGCARG